MVYTSSILPRPTISAPCTCIWAALETQRENAHHDQHASAQTALGQVAHNLNPLNALPSMPGMFGGSSNVEEHSTSPEDLPATSPRTPARNESNSGSTLPGQSTARTYKPNKVADRNPVLVDLKFGTIRTDSTERNAIAARMDAKSNVLNSSSWLAKARPFKIFGKSIDVKVAELISYREDLVCILESFIPARRVHDQHSTHPPVVLPVPQTPLCPTCQQNLAYALYHTPAAHSDLVRESSTAAFLTLMDDAIASLKASLPLEHISHHQLDSILRRELAVVEWRIAATLAKFHKKTGFLKEFPVRIGEYGQFNVNVKPPGAPDGVVKKLGNKVKGAIGLGGEGPSGEVQGPAGSDS